MRAVRDGILIKHTCLSLNSSAPDELAPQKPGRWGFVSRCVLHVPTALMKKLLAEGQGGNVHAERQQKTRLPSGNDRLWKPLLFNL